MLTMGSVVLTCFRGKYINFQLKLLYGKRVSAFGRAGCPTPTCLNASVPHGKRVYHGKVTKVLTMVSSSLPVLEENKSIFNRNCYVVSG